MAISHPEIPALKLAVDVETGAVLSSSKSEVLAMNFEILPCFEDQVNQHEKEERGSSGHHKGGAHRAHRAHLAHQTHEAHRAHEAHEAHQAREARCGRHHGRHGRHGHRGLSGCRNDWSEYRSFGHGHGCRRHPAESEEKSEQVTQVAQAAEDKLSEPSVEAKQELTQILTDESDVEAMIHQALQEAASDSGGCTPLAVCTNFGFRVDSRGRRSNCRS